MGLSFAFWVKVCFVGYRLLCRKEAMASESASSLRCFADIDIRKSVDETRKEFDKVLLHNEFVGIKIHPTNVGYPVDVDYFDKIFDYANRNRVPVEVHSYPRTHLLDDVCSPSRIKNVLKKYPSLKLSVAHLGGFQYEELQGTDAYVNISAILPDLVHQFGIKKTNDILRSFGTHRLIFATDYPDSRSLKPDEIYDRYLEYLGAMDFTQEEAENICKYNVLRMIEAQ